MKYFSMPSLATAPTKSGRPTGSYAWAGLGNTFYFVSDVRMKIGNVLIEILGLPLMLEYHRLIQSQVLAPSFRHKSFPLPIQSSWRSRTNGNSLSINSKARSEQAARKESSTQSVPPPNTSCSTFFHAAFSLLYSALLIVSCTRHCFASELPCRTQI